MLIKTTSFILKPCKVPSLKATQPSAFQMQKWPLSRTYAERLEGILQNYDDALKIFLMFPSPKSLRLVALPSPGGMASGPFLIFAFREVSGRHIAGSKKHALP